MKDKQVSGALEGRQMEPTEVLGDTLGRIAVSPLYGHGLSGEEYSIIFYRNSWHRISGSRAVLCFPPLAAGLYRVKTTQARQLDEDMFIIKLGVFYLIIEIKYPITFPPFFKTYRPPCVTCAYVCTYTQICMHTQTLFGVYLAQPIMVLSPIGIKIKWPMLAAFHSAQFLSSRHAGFWPCRKISSILVKRRTKKREELRNLLWAAQNILYWESRRICAMHQGQRVWLWFACNCPENAGGWVWCCGFNNRGKSPSWWGWGDISMVKIN